MNVAPTVSQDFNSLRQFLLAVLPADVEVIVGQPNRVPEAKSPRFVVMSPPSFTRLATNDDDDADVKFSGSIAGQIMTVTSVAFGTILVGATVFGVGVADGTLIQPGGGGSGGPGVYLVSKAQTVGPGTLSSGAVRMTQEVEVTVQLDFHSADATSGDLAQIVSTVLRDERGVEIFEAQGLGVSPLHADDPRQMPFVNDQQQVEWRWILDACLQVDQVVSAPQQYADALSIDVVSVDAAYPP